MRTRATLRNRWSRREVAEPSAAPAPSFSRSVPPRPGPGRPLVCTPEPGYSYLWLLRLQAADKAAPRAGRAAGGRQAAGGQGRETCRRSAAPQSRGGVSAASPRPAPRGSCESSRLAAPGAGPPSARGPTGTEHSLCLPAASSMGLRSFPHPPFNRWAKRGSERLSDFHVKRLGKGSSGI